MIWPELQALYHPGARVLRAIPGRVTPVLVLQTEDDGCILRADEVYGNNNTKLCVESGYWLDWDLVEEGHVASYQD